MSQKASTQATAKTATTGRAGERAPFPGPLERTPEQMLLHLQQAVGNRATQALLASGTIQPKLRVGPPDDLLEREADRVADSIVRMPEATAGESTTDAITSIQPTSSARAQRTCHECLEEEDENIRRQPRAEEEEEEEELLQRKGTEAAPVHVDAGIQSRINALRSGGQPLAPSMRALYESRFGRDFGDVRVHTGSAASEASRSINARAFTLGRDIVFDTGEYAPETSPGRHLLAHELAHTIQQSTNRRAGQVIIQRQRAGQSDVVTANAVFPYKQGERVTVNHLVSKIMLTLIEMKNKELAQMLRSLVKRRARVTTATKDVFEAHIEAEEKTKDQPGREALILRLERSGKQFTLEFLRVDQKGKRVPLSRLSGLTARRKGSEVLLSGEQEGTPFELGTRPGKAPREYKLRLLSPLKLELIGIKTLANARAGSPEERKVIERAAAESQASRRLPRQRLRIGGGAFWHGGEPVAPLFTMGWQMNFSLLEKIGRLAQNPLLEKIGRFAQIPLEVQLQYAPKAGFLASLSTGVEASFSPFVPINVRLVTGVAGGTLHPSAVGGGEERQLLLGPTVGGSLGYEKGWFRVDVRYEHLINLLNQSPDADSLLVRAAAAF